MASAGYLPKAVVVLLDVLVKQLSENRRFAGVSRQKDLNLIDAALLQRFVAERLADRGEKVRHATFDAFFQHFRQVQLNISVLVFDIELEVGFPLSLLVKEIYCDRAVIDGECADLVVSEDIAIIGNGFRILCCI